jgi:putative salt-induced outer membrane protein YdiY
MKAILAAVGGSLVLSAAVFAEDRVELKSGDVLIGRVLVRTVDEVRIDHPKLGEITIAADDVAMIEFADPAAAPPVMPVPPEPEPEEESPWLSEIDLGASGSQGNTDFLNFRAAFRTERESERHRWRFDASYYLGFEDGDRNQHRATVGALKDWLFVDSPWLLFATARFDFDDFRSWTYRLSGHGGVGYTFIDDDTFQLIGRAGPAATKRWKRTESIDPEGLLGLELRWTIDDRQRLTASTTMYPALDDFFEFRQVSAVRWTMSIDRARGMNLSAGIEHEYESDVPADTKKHDLRFFAGLTFAF